MLTAFQLPRELKQTLQISAREGVSPGLIHMEHAFSPKHASNGRQPHFSFAFRETGLHGHFSPCAVTVCLRRTFHVPQCFHNLPVTVLPVSGNDFLPEIPSCIFRSPERMSFDRRNVARPGTIITEKRMRTLRKKNARFRKAALP